MPSISNVIYASAIAFEASFVFRVFGFWFFFCRVFVFVFQWRELQLERRTRTAVLVCVSWWPEIEAPANPAWSSPPPPRTFRRTFRRFFLRRGCPRISIPTACPLRSSTLRLGVCVLFNYCSDFKLLCLVAEKSVGWEKKLVRWIGAVVWWFCCVVLCVKLERFSIFFGFWKSVFVHWESVGKKVRVWDYIGKNGVKCCVVSC